MQFESCEVSFEIIPRNEEVANYRADLHEALTKGGWKLALKDPIRYVENLQEGLNINFIQTPEHARQPYGPKNRRQTRLLQQAFGLAGLRIYGGGSGTGIDVKEDSLLIRIGERRSDWYEMTHGLEA